MHELDYLQAQKQIKGARVVMFIIAALSMILGGYIYLSGNTLGFIDETAVIDGFLFLVFALISYRSPLWGIGLGLTFYLLGNIVMFFNEPSTILKGVIIKVYVIYVLVKGIKAAYQIRNYQSEDDLIHKIEEIGTDNEQESNHIHS